MDGNITIKYLQNYIKAKDYAPEYRDAYFVKLIEEVGELARAVHKGLPAGVPSDGDITNTVDEEIYDVIYYALALANVYGIDIESVIPRKEAITNRKYRHEDLVFEVGR